MPTNFVTPGLYCSDGTEGSVNWTTIRPSDGTGASGLTTSIIYCDPSVAGPGTGTLIDPFQSFRTALNTTTTGNPDWVLVKRGTRLENMTFETILGNNFPRNGPLVAGSYGTEPFLISNYDPSILLSGNAVPNPWGSALARPIMTTPADFTIATFIGGAGRFGDNCAFMGFDFYCYTQDPDVVTFTVTAANATSGAIYSNNGQTFAVIISISGATTLYCNKTGNPAASGTLTKVSGTGDATITFSAFSVGKINNPGNASGIVEGNSQINYLLIEDNRFKYFTDQIDFTATETAGFQIPVTGITIRRNVVFGATGATANQQGFVGYFGTNFTCQENILDRNGWDGITPDIHNRNAYFYNHDRIGSQPITSVKGNIFARSSDTGAQFRSGANIVGNLFLANTNSAGLDFGHHVEGDHYFVEYVTGGSITDNVFLEGRFGLQFSYTDGTSILCARNIVAHMASGTGNPAVQFDRTTRYVTFNNNIIYDTPDGAWLDDSLNGLVSTPPGGGNVIVFDCFDAGFSGVNVGDTYSANGNTYTIVRVISAVNVQQLYATGSGDPASSVYATLTLTRVTGTGTASIFCEGWARGYRTWTIANGGLASTGSGYTTDGYYHAFNLTGGTPTTAAIVSATVSGGAVTEVVITPYFDDGANGQPGKGYSTSLPYTLSAADADLGGRSGGSAFTLNAALNSVGNGACVYTSNQVDSIGTGSYGVRPYPAPNRRAADYCAYVGIADQSVNGFLTAAEGMYKNNWNPAYTARSFNIFIQQGFGESMPVSGSVVLMGQACL